MRDAVFGIVSTELQRKKNCTEFQISLNSLIMQKEKV